MGLVLMVLITEFDCSSPRAGMFLFSRLDDTDTAPVWEA